jgi:8-amino-7-oxononanoate synthase
LKEYLVNRARTFIFSTAMPPYLAGQIRAALAIARKADDRRQHLSAIANALREKFAAAGVKTGVSSAQIIPILTGSNEAALRVAAEMQAHGFAAKAIRPPTVPEGASRVRISLTSAISMDEISRLAEVIAAAMRKLPEMRAAGAVHA